MTEKTAITGFPRIGENRELKKALEDFWSGRITESGLESTAAEIRRRNWLAQKRLGIDLISSNDFSLYDGMLDTAVMLNAVPARFSMIENRTERYFAMARGCSSAQAMEMTKWFNTNYHYIVPELEKGMRFHSDAGKIISEYNEAAALGIKTKINVIGPLTFLGLSRTSDGCDPFEFYEPVMAAYKDLFRKISELDDDIVIQVDEPFLVKDPSAECVSMISGTYGALASAGDNLRIIVSTYFDHAAESIAELAATDIWGIGLDFVYGRKNLKALDKIGEKMLIAGVVDGRNIWLNNFGDTLNLLESISLTVPRDRIIVSTSCSLLHTPYSAANEPESRIKKHFSFCLEKTAETAFLGKTFRSGELTADDKTVIELNRSILEERIVLEPGKPQTASGTKPASSRNGSFSERSALQKTFLSLPKLPTTTIGSFPQTAGIRKTRSDYRKGLINREQYEAGIKTYIDDCISFQERIGLDVLVHGEPERNDMVEYFGELLDGFHFTSNGWVQSYGSRCVKPPVIYGDISRPGPMTVKWISYAQSRTSKPVKGMLTGPVTIINWSFVRNDVPKSETAFGIASALNEEIRDLQAAGIRIIQVDEAAFKEGYPLRKENVPEYEKWAVDSFRTAVSSAEKETQIHTHMCYSDFSSIMDTIEKMDADVITIETARSGNRLLGAFSEKGYCNEIGPGVYDIHSPRIPSVEEFREQIKLRLDSVEASRMWINPDCGLKTRRWEEVEPALKNMVLAASEVRLQV